MSEGYDPEWIEFETSGGIPALPNDPDERREAFNAGLVEFAKRLPTTDPGIKTRDAQISPEVTVRVYTPPSHETGKLPCVVYAPGGGWLSGNLDTENHMCRTLCEQVSCMVVSVDYRKFPWVKFPSPIDDCYTAYQWAYENAEQLGADKTRYAIGGGSAGAALAIAVTYRLISTGQGDHIRGLISMSGMFLHPEVVPEPYQKLHKSYVENGGKVPVVTGDEMQMAYAINPGRENVDKVEWFPVSGGATALKGFPRTYLINTSKEACRDDSTVMEAALKDAGVPVKLDTMPNLPHYFHCFGMKNAGQRFRNALVDGTKWAVET